MSSAGRSVVGSRQCNVNNRERRGGGREVKESGAVVDVDLDDGGGGGGDGGVFSSSEMREERTPRELGSGADAAAEVMVWYADQAVR